ATANALKAMDGAVMGTCPNRIVVHLHELKKVKDSRPAHHEPPVLLLAKLQATDPLAQNLGKQTAQDNRVALGEPMNQQATVGAHTGAPVKESGLMVQTGGGSRRSSTLASPGSSVLGGGAGADGFGNGAAAGGWRRGVTGAAGQAPATRDRKLCLFNLQVLATNVAEAREIINTPDELVPHTSNKVPPQSPQATLRLSTLLPPPPPQVQRASASPYPCHQPKRQWEARRKQTMCPDRHLVAGLRRRQRQKSQVWRS
ncbi:hypothetical protein PCANC_12364, partial [Puccinia coronata f. sp. avenae]